MSLSTASMHRWGTSLPAYLQLLVSSRYLGMYVYHYYYYIMTITIHPCIYNLIAVLDIWR